MEKMGWTWEQLQETPESVIIAMLAKWDVEARHQEEERKKMEQKLKSARLHRKARA